MKRTTYGMLMVACATILFAVAGMNSASAQLFDWKPPCTNTSITNATACAAALKLSTNSGILGPFNVPAGATRAINLPNNTTIFGIRTQAGSFVAAVTPGPTIPPPGPAGTTARSWVPAVTIGPGCCADVYFDISSAPNCVIWLVPNAGPCTP